MSVNASRSGPRRGYGDNDASSRGAALLLMEMSKIASSEVDQSKSPRSLRPSEVDQTKPPRSFRPSIIASGTYKSRPGSNDSPFFVSTHQISTLAETNPSRIDNGLRSRNRTVSMDSMHHIIPLSPRYESEADEESLQSTPAVIPASPRGEPRPSLRKKNFVGNDVHSRLKGVLRKKYAWREFPELEGYLIENRDQYLSFSSQLNYTAEQKRYNNRLTQGLLDLAAESGYKFEGFTFAMIRDRIRCYYKSYVQAVKKKKRKKRH